jgi:hypothetical protein
MKTRYKFLREGLKSSSGDCVWKIGEKKNSMEDTIKIPRKWLERLIELDAMIQNSQERGERDTRVGYLLGYIESAKSLLSSE